MSEKMIGSVLVAGGGIAGIQAALDLADSGYRVYLVEKESAIGGVMAQLDKTFPTNDCSMCIISPKLVEAGRHLNIELLTLTEIEAISGTAGNFKVTLKTKPRFVDITKCTACGECTQVCPVDIPNLFDQGLRLQKAVHKLYPQAIPGAFTIQKSDKAPCRLACPASLNVQGYVQMVKTGRYREALEIIMEELPLPGVIGRICPHGCEDACRRCDVDEPVAIRDLKRLAADKYDVRDVKIKCQAQRSEKVAIIGSGPAGLSAAYHLARQGILATIFEALPEAGGMLRTGIPKHRLPREILDREIEVITRLGVKIKTGKALGPDMTVDDLLNNGYNAVYLALGAHKGLTLGIPGEKADGVLQGVHFLRRVNLGIDVPVGNDIVIIGGGNVAIDVARVAVRLGAENAKIIYRRTRDEMPAWDEEISAAEDEGVIFHYLAAPQEILTESGRVAGVRCIKMELGEPDSSGRRRPVPVPGSEYDLSADQIIPAIGQVPDLSAIEDLAGLSVSKWGTLEVDPLTYATNREGVFAGGDLTTGPWVAIGAIAAGREAAESIVRFLDGHDMARDREDNATSQTAGSQLYAPIPEGMQHVFRKKMPQLSPESRKGNFKEVDLGYSEEAGKSEAERCLNCGDCCECGQCVNACLADAVSHSMGPEYRDIDVGAVIAAPGFVPFNPNSLDQYSYKHHPNVVTSLEFERILSASGPYEGHLMRPSDHQEPEKIAWIQCVGSRDINRCDNGYCSSVCCMYTNKQTVIAKEHSKNPLDTAVFFMDMRTHGKDFEKYYMRAEQQFGVRYIRSRIHSVIPASENLLELRYVTENGTINTEHFDMVVLAIGLSPPDGIQDFSRRLGIGLNDAAFARTSSDTPVKSSRDGIFVCGAFREPKDIPQSVMEASAAAAEAGRLLADSRNTLTRGRELPPEINIDGQPPRIGVFVCNCGINIGGIADIKVVTEYARTLPHVVYTEENLFTCSQDSQDHMKHIILEKGINRVVVASCSPRTHEPLFQETIREVGLNPYLFEMANIRDQNTWVHMNNPDIATKKAKDLVRMAVAKAALIRPLPRVKLDVKQAALVVGGGVAGMEAALGLAKNGYSVFLVERNNQLGGVARELNTFWDGQIVSNYLKRKIDDIYRQQNIRVFLNSEVVETKGIIGNFESTVLTGKSRLTSINIVHGATILATGGKEDKPEQYLYGAHPNVLTLLEFDAAIRSETAKIRNARTAVFIQCVGSRTPERPYCSRLCCTHSLKSAIALREMNPYTSVFIIYRDIRAYGFREALYQKAREKGVIFIRYDLDTPPKTEIAKDGTLVITMMDHIICRPVQIETDLLVLAAAALPNENRDLFELFKVPVNSDGFLVEAHAKLRPVDFASEGLFLAGLAHYPKPLDESIAQAKAAVSRVSALLASGSITVGGVVAGVAEPERCACCLVCVRSCPYGVPYVKEGHAVIEPAQCHGCGVCAAECPAKVITLHHFTDQQITAKSRALFDEAGIACSVGVG